MTECVEAARASNPACRGYMDVIGRYVELYGGGPGAPMVKYMDEFAKGFGENLRLGEEYWKALLLWIYI